MQSVQAKSLHQVLTHTLRQDFGQSRIEAEVLAARSLEWLQILADPQGAGTPPLPGRVRLSVPDTPSRRYAGRRRRQVTVTAVSVGEDTEIWRQWGLAVMQRHRLLRWLYEVYRQGGWASLAEVGVWANLTPNALGARLAPARQRGIWLPHVAGPPARDEHLALEPWLVDRYLRDGRVEPHCAELGLVLACWEAVFRRFVQVVGDAGSTPEILASKVGASPLEIRQFRMVAEKHRRRRLLRDLLASYGVPKSGPPVTGSQVEAELIAAYRFSPVAARLYHRWLMEFTAKLQTGPLNEGEMVFLAISAAEGAQSRLAEARHIPVRLQYLVPEDVPNSVHRVSDLKFGRLVRYAAEARAQGALLTLPDLAVLLGIHVDAIRHQIDSHPEVVVPTRGRMRDIGRGISHKARIVELYLQMHTETEIVDRTGHAYESVEAYLREFARVVTLADRGMNAVMIRRITGRSLALVEAYLDLYRRYDRPDYHFRLAQIRNVFARDEILAQKRGPVFRSRTGGGTT
jgi:hypothetical protein